MNPAHQTPMKAQIYQHLGIWHASISGPWYDDSDPEGEGTTQEVAEQKAWQSLLDLQKEVNDFVAQGKPTFKDVTS